MVVISVEHGNLLPFGSSDQFHGSRAWNCDR
jgi:hypothetical protein